MPTLEGESSIDERLKKRKASRKDNNVELYPELRRSQKTLLRRDRQTTSFEALQNFTPFSFDTPYKDGPE